MASPSNSRGRRGRRSPASSSSSATSPARWTRTRGRCSSTCTRSSGSGRGVEAFAFGTRLTRLTPDLATRDPEAALARATEIAIDWGSGTRIGNSLAEFNSVYGRRALSRGAVVVIVSDGWERDDPDLIAREMAKLARASYAVVWVNPLKGNPEYQPLAGGMRAALPFVDRFLPGHNLRSLEELGAVLAGIERRHAA